MSANDPKTKPPGCILSFRIQPKASRNEVVGLHGDAYKVALTAPPVKGEANKELIRYLAKRLGVPKSKLQILHGESGRNKMLRIEGIEENEAKRMLEAISKGSR